MKTRQIEHTMTNDCLGRLLQLSKLRLLAWPATTCLGALLMTACLAQVADSASVDMDEGADPPVGQAQAELKNGSPTSSVPCVGQVFGLRGGGWCTATLITPRHVLTAAHCNWHYDTLVGTPTFTAGGVTRNVINIYKVGAGAAPGGGMPPGNYDLNPDVTLLELEWPGIPDSAALSCHIAAGPPAPGTPSWMYGFGGTGSDCTNAGTKRIISFNFGSPTYQFCPGDSGGPAVSNSHIWGVASHTPPEGDVWGDVSRYKEDMLSVIRLWEYGHAGGLDGGEPNVTRVGVLLTTIPNSTPTTCKDACNSNTSCNSWTLVLQSSLCVLNRDAGDWWGARGYASGLSTTNRFEVDIDRPGYDYRYYTTTLNSCSLDCSSDARCAAFSWVASSQLCFLKQYLGHGVGASGVTSGTKRNFEHYTDRPGYDLASFWVYPPDVRVCQAACSARADCFRYTYRIQTPQEEAYCWLKSSAASPVTIVADPPNGKKLYISGKWKTTP